MADNSVTRRPELPNPDSDVYVMGDGSRPMPRTTSVIDRGIGKPFLTTWAARLEREAVLDEVGRTLADHVDEVRARAILKDLSERLPRDLACDAHKKEAADFGTEVHEILEDRLRARIGLPPGEGREAKEPSALAVRAADLAVAWLDAIDFVPDAAGIEERLWSEDERIWSAGTADAFGTADLDRLLAATTSNRKLKQDSPAGSRVPLLIDWKTSKSINVSHKVQIGAYIRYMIDRGRLSEPCHACILRMPKFEKDEPAVEALLIQPTEFAHYGGAFRLIRRIFNFLSLEDELERTQWRARRRAAG